MILRESYLKKIRRFYDKDLIKVITGIRRSGKSVILTQIIDEIKQSKVNDNHIIYMNLENIEFDSIKTYMDLNNYVEKNIVDKELYYVFIDEVQHVKEWEKTIASLKATKNVSIFITGSNSDLLSGDLASLISGRYVEFKMLPLKRHVN